MMKVSKTIKRLEKLERKLEKLSANWDNLTEDQKASVKRILNQEAGVITRLEEITE